MRGLQKPNKPMQPNNPIELYVSRTLTCHLTFAKHMKSSLSPFPLLKEGYLTMGSSILRKLDVRDRKGIVVIYVPNDGRRG
jgi:hypothetical protein